MAGKTAKEMLEAAYAEVIKARDAKAEELTSVEADFEEKEVKLQMQHKEARVSLREELRDLNAPLRAAGLVEKRKNFKKPASGSTYRTSEESIETVKTAILEHFGDGAEFTVAQVMEHISLSEMPTRASVLALRDEGVLRRTGEKRLPNSNGKAAHFAVVAPEEGE